jgi:Flp pilus assembly protein TadG
MERELIKAVRAPARHNDDGAAAVEFALISTLLFTILFAIVQYGMIFYQLQAESSLVHDAARWAASGIDECQDFKDAVTDRATRSSIPTPTNVAASFSGPPGYPTEVTVQVTFSPTNFRLPFIPYPGSITTQALASVTSRGAETTSC